MHMYLRMVTFFNVWHILQNIAMRDYQLPRKWDVRTDTQTDAGPSDPYVPLCFAGDTKIVSMQLHFEQLW